jgi:hypothetical protein
MRKKIGDEFDSSTGEFVDYDTTRNPTVHANQIADQKHTDIRVMAPRTALSQITMADLTAIFDMEIMTERTMSSLGGTIPANVGEEWTKGVIAEDPARNNWQVLTVPCDAGSTVFQSVLRS